MDDRLKARLRVVADPVEPRAEFVEQLHDTLAARLGFPVPVDRRTKDVRLRRSGRPWLLVAATIAVTIALVGGALVAGVVDRLQPRPSVLETVQSNGKIRFAVRPDHPQVLVPGGALAGFDIDVARALGDRLELDTELVVMTVDQMLTDDPRRWDVAMPSTSLPAEAARRFSSTAPYYYWPFYVLVPRSSAALEVSDLDGMTICVVAQSAGEAWLAPSANLAEPRAVLSAPTEVVLRSLEDDAACTDEVEAGGSVALVTAAFTEADLASRPDYRVIGDAPAGWKEQVMIVNSQDVDPTSLVAALNEALAALRRDGTLTRFSQLRFGGQDLSQPPT